MDHAEEQAMELEALEAIYGDDFRRVSGEGGAEPATCEVALRPGAAGGSGATWGAARRAGIGQRIYLQHRG